MAGSHLHASSGAPACPPPSCRDGLCAKVSSTRDLGSEGPEHEGHSSRVSRSASGPTQETSGLTTNHVAKAESANSQQGTVAVGTPATVGD